ncbi:hypothetical protein [Paraburkholderia fungorum]|uniref:hypothetical protein n=1 Tax=Paraburkholderia fungorum TaxID=134537 RepID=UPI00161E18ED|nr:hypothetical protein [Paraburkholderia fungorum]MBB5546621.1 hypothetical protein [Paraburkholderia fungorum]
MIESKSEASNQNDQIDVALLHQLAKAATQGQWTWWTSNSVRRLSAAGGPDGGVAQAYKIPGENTADIRISEEDMAFIEACNPETIIALLKRIATLEQRATMMSAATLSVHGTMDELGQSEDGGYDMTIGVDGSKISVRGLDRESSRALARGLFGAVRLDITVESAVPGKEDSPEAPPYIDWIVQMLSKVAGMEKLAPDLSRRLGEVIAAEFGRAGKSLQMEQLLDALDRIAELRAFSENVRKATASARATFGHIFG